VDVKRLIYIVIMQAFNEFHSCARQALFSRVVLSQAL